MFWYFLKLAILLPLVGGMAFGALWLWRKYQPGLMGGGQGDRAVKLLDAVPMGNFGKLAVVEFEGRRILLSVTRGRIEKISESGEAAPAASAAQRALEARLAERRLAEGRARER